MLEIGYIYIFSREEKKGILVYGKNSGPYWDKYRPIKFSKSDCLTEVSTGDLVYFNNSEGACLNIERATLGNFKRDLFESYVYPQNSFTLRDVIVFENIADLKEIEIDSIEKSEKDGLCPYEMEDSQIIKDYSEDFVDSENPQISEATEEFYLQLVEIDDDDDLWESSTNWDPRKNEEWEYTHYKRIDLPSSIEDLFDLFGSQYHRKPESLSVKQRYSECEFSDYISINLKDIRLWKPESLENRLNCEKNLEELFTIFTLFEGNRIQENKSRWLNYRMLNYKTITPRNIDYGILSEKEREREILREHYKCDVSVYIHHGYDEMNLDRTISGSWRLLLKNLSNKALREIIKKAPALQPVLPKHFCLENIDLLSTEFGFVDEEVCQSFLSNLIAKTNTTEEYIERREWLHALKESVRVIDDNYYIELRCLSDKYLDSKLLQLDSIFDAKIINKIRDEYLYRTKVAEKGNDFELLENRKILYGLGLYLECRDNYEQCVEDNLLAKYYNALPRKYKISLEADYVNSLYYVLGKYIDHYIGRSYYICEFIQKNYLYRNMPPYIREKLREYSLKTNNFYELEAAYKCRLINEEDFAVKFQSIVGDSQISELVSIIQGYKMCIPPESTLYAYQKLLEKCVDELGKASGLSVEINGRVVSDLREILEELELCPFESEKKGKIECEILKCIGEEHLLELFNEGLISNPGREVIQSMLSDLFVLDKYDFARKYGSDIINQPLFQNALMEELSKNYEISQLYDIIDYLTDGNLYSVFEEFSNHISLYALSRLIQYSENECLPIISGDEEIFTHFNALYTKDQIIIFKYLVHLYEEGSISIDVERLWNSIQKADIKVCSYLKFLIRCMYDYKNNQTMGLDELCWDLYQDILMFRVYNRIHDGRISNPISLCGGQFLYSKEETKFDEIECIGSLEKVEGSWTIKLYGFNDIIERQFISDEELWKLEIEYDISSQNIRALIKNNFKYEKNGDEYILIEPNDLLLRRIVSLHKIEDNGRLFKNGGAYLKLHKTDFEPNIFAARFPATWQKDNFNGYPYCWCGDKICVGCARVFRADWKSYQLADFLRVCSISSLKEVQQVWNYVAYISRILNKKFKEIQTDLQHAHIYEIIENDNRGVEDVDTTIYEEGVEYGQDVYEDYDN